MKVTYNSPAILSFTLIATAVQVLSDVLGPTFTSLFTTYPTFQFFNPLWYLRLISHIAGHSGWEHLVGNFSLILLIGPTLEEKYGSKNLVYMILVTAIVTSLLNSLLFPTGLLGASGIVFMLILLSSVTNVRKGELPLTFILVASLYLGKEIVTSFQMDNISQFGHIMGGIAGGFFGFSLSKGTKNVG